MCWAPGRQTSSPSSALPALLLYLANPPPDSLRTNTTSLSTSRPRPASRPRFSVRSCLACSPRSMASSCSWRSPLPDFAPQQLILVFSVWRQTLAFARLRFSKSLSFPLFPIHTFGEWEHASRNASKKTDGRNTQLGGRSVDRNDRAPRRSRSFATYTCDASLVRRAASRRSTRSP